MTSVAPRWAATARESIARFVTLSDSVRIASAMPGTSRGHAARVASGVTSRGPRPVPPVVKTTSACSSSASRTMAAAMAAVSSGTSSRATTVQPCASQVSAIVGPEVSSAEPA